MVNQPKDNIFYKILEKIYFIVAEPPKESPAKSFSRIMEKVVFAMSGFQNPYRAELRDRAMAMGAMYKPDWGKGCTHLM